MDSIDQQQAAIMDEHKGKSVPFEGGSTIVRPLTMADLLDPTIVKALGSVGKVLFSSLEKVQKLLAPDAGDPDIDALMELLAPAMPAVGACLKRCIDKPLEALPHWAAPAILKEFLSQNFTAPRLKSWVDLFQMVGAQMMVRRPADRSPSPTLIPSSELPDIDDGDASPATSSSSTSGPQ